MVEVNNLTTIKIDKNLLKKIAEKVLTGRNFDLSIALVDEKRIKELNRIYRQRNRPVKKDKSSFPPFAAARATDVLSFDYQTPTRRGAGGKENEVLFDCGEIVICPAVVQKNAQKYKSDFKLELARILIHGILHLLGYNHEKNKKEAQKMQKRENYYLSKI